MGASYILTHINLHTFAKYLPKIIEEYCDDTIITMNSSTHIAEQLHHDTFIFYCSNIIDNYLAFAITISLGKILMHMHPNYRPIFAVLHIVKNHYVRIYI